MSVKVSPKFQVVIPESVRSEVNLQPGSRVEVIAKGGIVYLVPVPELKDLQKALKGKLDSKGLREKKDRKL